MLIIGNKKYRNLQEQVGFNTEQIEKIFETLDGINVQDNLVKLTSASGILTAEEMEIVSREVAFIEYNANLYIKSNTTASEFIFKQIALSASDQGTYNILQSFRIVITIASGAYAYSSNTVLSLYNKSEMDALLATKADGSALTAGLALKADLAGANFTGDITAPAITENMVGYSFNYPSNALTALITYGYAGVVKNGNKITFVIAGNLTTESSDLSGTTQVIGNFAIPRSVGENIYPINGEHVAYLRVALAKDYTSFKNASIIPAKFAHTQLGFYLSITEALQTNTNYYFRFEFTLLLGDNLAS